MERKNSIVIFSFLIFSVLSGFIAAAYYLPKFVTSTKPKQYTASFGASDLDGQSSLNPDRSFVYTKDSGDFAFQIELKTTSPEAYLGNYETDNYLYMVCGGLVSNNIQIDLICQNAEIKISNVVFIIKDENNELIEEGLTHYISNNGFSLNNDFQSDIYLHSFEVTFVA